MPYPTEIPKAKHDLVVPQLPPDGTLNDRMGFQNAKVLFDAVERPPVPPADPNAPKKLAAVYSYPDAPNPPLSRSLLVVGVADVSSCSVARKLVGDVDAVPDCLRRCTIAVKRADGSYVHTLAPKDVTNSQSFGKLMRRLRREGAVGILSQDKYRRFGILMPMEASSFPRSEDGDFQEDDFAALCFVGEVEGVKEFLTRGVIAAAAAHSEPEENGCSSELWQPEGNQEEDGGGAFWQPPGGDQENGDSGFSWNPPTSGDAEEPFGGFGDASGDGGSSDPWKPATSPREPSQSNGNKRKRDSDGDGDGDGEFHTDKTAQAADAFYSGLTRTLTSRAESRIYHMRAFNGWVKATQIQELDPRTEGRGPLRILDLACGKGGDLGKWVLHKRGIRNYVGSDVARGSLRDAAVRARGMRRKLHGRCTFTCADLGSDVPGRLKSTRHRHMQKLLTWSLQSESEHESGPPDFQMVRGGGIALDDKFDVVSIQFAIHYMMSSRKRARRFFQTVSELLEVGGNLICTTIDARIVLEKMMGLGLDLRFDDSGDDGDGGDEDDSHNSEEVEKSPAGGGRQGAVVTAGNGACRIQFEPAMVKRIFTKALHASGDDEDMFGLEYTFTLVEGSDHEAGVGDAVNLPEWLTPIPVLTALAADAGLELEYAQNFHEFYANRSNPAEHGAAHGSLYNMRVLNRGGSISAEEWSISRLYAALKFRKVRESNTRLDSDEDDGGATEEEEEEEEKEEEIDPTIMAKFFPLAMMSAKRAAGEGVWATLASDERTRLTNIELRKIAKQQNM